MPCRGVMREVARWFGAKVLWCVVVAGHEGTGYCHASLSASPPRHATVIPHPSDVSPPPPLSGRPKHKSQSFVLISRPAHHLESP